MDDPATPSDDELAIAAGLRAGRPDAWARLHDEYAPRVWRTVARLLGFAAVTAHVLDVGGSYPGINADAYDVYAEAKLYNALRWYRRGELNEDVDRLIFDNVRTESMNRGDMNAMLAACQLGRDRFLRLTGRYGVETVMSSAYGWMDYSEKMLREQIAKIPDGEYTAPTAWLDDDARTRGVTAGETRVDTIGAAEGTAGTAMLGGGGAILAALPMPLGSLTELLRPLALPGPRGMPLTPASWARAGAARLAANTKAKRTDFKRTDLPNMIPLQCQSA